MQGLGIVRRTGKRLVLIINVTHFIIFVAKKIEKKFEHDVPNTE